MSPNNALHSDGPRVARPAGERGVGRPLCEVTRRCLSAGGVPLLAASVQSAQRAQRGCPIIDVHTPSSSK